MKYPPEVQERIDFMKDYTENTDLKYFNILHMYPGKLAYPDGFTFARWFNLIAFNSKTREKHDLGRHDKIDVWENARVKAICVYADGSIYVEFYENVRHVGNTQAISIDGEETK